MKNERRRGFPWRALALIFGVATVVNYAWELAQAPLYVGLKNYSAGVFWHCFVASLGDGVIVLLIVVVGWFTLRQSDWFLRTGVRGCLVMITAGLVLALLVEWVAVHILNRWEYTRSMPTLPVVHIGLVPVAQMLILPPLIFRIVATWSYKTRP